MFLDIKTDSIKTYIFFTGELVESTAIYVKTCLDRLVNTISTEILVLDFAHLQFMDSTGIGILLGRYKRFKEKGIKINIIHPNKHVDFILKTAGIYSIMPKIV